jgi:hypothetical protein
MQFIVILCLKLNRMTLLRPLLFKYNFALIRIIVHRNGIPNIIAKGIDRIILSCVYRRPRP